MKKYLLIAIGLTLAISLIAYAGALKLEFSPFGGYSGAENGFVIVNETPDAAVEVVIQIQIRDATPGVEYEVKSKTVPLGTFTAAKNGNGKLHLNLTSAEYKDDVERAINIWRGGLHILTTEKFNQE